MSTSTVDHAESPLAMNLSVDWDALTDELFRQGVFAKLSLFDLLRARVVCKRWQEIIAQSLDAFDSHDVTKSYCPLIFKQIRSLPRLWCGYDCATDAWELLPSLTNLPQCCIRPLAGMLRTVWHTSTFLESYVTNLLAVMTYFQMVV